ncbi:hypothetical protein L6R53_31075 [Myxococcota bacterium]|nr:hypothetical protein [Myxococcota bacterium]
MPADATLKAKIENALRDRFPKGRVGVFDGYLVNVHVIVVDEAFRGHSDTQRQDLLWEVLEGSLTPGEVVKVSLALGFTEDEPESQAALSQHGAA